MANEDKTSQTVPPMSPPPPPPPSPATVEVNSTEVILCADSNGNSFRTPHTDLLSLWLSNYVPLPQPQAEEEPLLDVHTLLNFNLESSFPDLLDCNTNSTTITQAPIVTQRLWGQLHTPIAGQVHNQSSIPSILPLALGVYSPPRALRVHSPVSPLDLEVQSPQTSFWIQSAPASVSSLPTISSTLPTTAPPVGNSLPSPAPVPDRCSWSVILSTPPAWQHLLLPHSASSSVSVPYSHPSHHPNPPHFFPATNTGHQQDEPGAHSPVAFSTPNANSLAEFVPASGPSGSQAMVSPGSWIRDWIPNQPSISNGEDMNLSTPPRCPQLVVPPVAATMPDLPQLLANFGSSVGNMPLPSNSNAEEDVPVEGHQRNQTGESSRRSRMKSKKSKLPVRIDKKQFK